MLSEQLCEVASVGSRPAFPPSFCPCSGCFWPVMQQVSCLLIEASLGARIKPLLLAPCLCCELPAPCFVCMPLKLPAPLGKGVLSTGGCPHTNSHPCLMCVLYMAAPTQGSSLSTLALFQCILWVWVLISGMRGLEPLGVRAPSSSLCLAHCNSCRWWRCCGILVLCSILCVVSTGASSCCIAHS